MVCSWQHYGWIVLSCIDAYWKSMSTGIDDWVIGAAKGWGRGEDQKTLPHQHPQCRSVDQTAICGGEKDPHLYPILA